MVNKYQLQFGKEDTVLPYGEIGKQLHDKPATVKVKGENNSYFHRIVYFLWGPRISTLHIGSWYVNTLQMKIIHMQQSYISPEYGSGKDYIEKMKFQKKYMGE